jgi:hypothetical protein
MMQDDLKEISSKMKQIYDNVKNIEFKNENMIDKINYMIDGKEPEKKTKIMPVLNIA